MKTLRMIGMAFVAVFLCMACSSDDEETKPNGPGGDKKGKKLIKLEVIQSDSRYENNLYTFSYDEENRVTSILEESSQYNEPYEISGIAKTKWYTDSLKFTYTSPYLEIDATFILKNGLITKSTAITDYSGTSNNSYPFTRNYTYNTLNQITGIGGDERTCSWNNGKITELHGYLDTKLEYENQTCKGYFPLYGDIWLLTENDFDMALTFIAFANPEILGLRNNNLPWKTEDNYYGTVIWHYTLDKDGYVKDCRASNGWHYSFEWE